MHFKRIKNLDELIKKAIEKKQEPSAEDIHGRDEDLPEPPDPDLTEFEEPTDEEIDAAISREEARHENIFGSSLNNKTAVTDPDELSAKDTLEEKDKSLPKNMVKDYEGRARSEREAGGTIEINERLPYIAINMSDGSEYFFQGEEASMLLDEVPDNIHAEDFILAIAQGW